MRIYSIIISVGAVIMILDQWTKNLALEALKTEAQTIPFLGNWWSWTLVYNPGAAFGIFRNLPDSIRTIFFILLPLGILTLLWWSYVRHFKKDSIIGPAAMGLVFGGALGNLVDRIRFGHVVDFIDWHFPWTDKCPPLFYHFTPISCHWPKFNIADSAITVAMILLFIHLSKESKLQKTK